MISNNSVTIVSTENGSWPKGLSFDTAWIFTNNISLYSKFSANIPEGIDLKPPGDVINAIADRLRDEFINIDQKLVRGRFYQSWLASNLAERNPYRSDFFLNICQIIAVMETVRQGGQHCVLVEDHYFGNLLVNTCRDNKINVSRHNFADKSPRYRWIKIIRALLSGLKFSQKQISAGKKWRGQRAVQKNGIYLLSWANSDTFPSEESKIHDSNFGVLPQWIRDLNQTPHWLANPLSWWGPLPLIVANASAAYDVAIPIPALITYKDIWSALLGFLSFPRAIKTGLKFDGYDVSAILRYYVQSEISNSQIVQALLFANVAKNMKRRQIKPKTLIYTYENQPWEKILLSGFRQHFPHTKLIGVQHAPFSDQYLSVYPSARQWAEGTVPDRLVTIGPEFQKQLIAGNAPSEKVVVGGSLRMPHLATNSPPDPNNISYQIKNILVSCPMQVGEATELSVKAVCATQDIKNTEVVINFHPSSGQVLIDSVKNAIYALPFCDHVKFTNETVNSWLEKSDLLIYNSSGTVFDAAHKGIPALYVGPLNGLDLDKLPRKETIICRTIEDLRIAIDQLLTHPKTTDETIEKEIGTLLTCFTKPNQKVWHSLLTENFDADT